MTPSLSCQKVSELLSQALDEPLGVIDQLRLKYHLSVCGNCRNVDEQLKQLSGLILRTDTIVDAEAQELNLKSKNQG